MKLLYYVFLKFLGLPAHEIILMPALSPTMTSGNIGAYQKKVGDQIQSGDVLCEIETDKAQMDFEMQEEGYLAKILIAEGTKEALVGKPLAILVSKREDIEAFANYTESAVKAEIKEQSDSVKAEIKEQSDSVNADSKANNLNLNTVSVGSDDRVKASPLAKKLASEKGINLTELKGSGPNGRIIKNDLLTIPKQPTISRKPPISGTSASFVDIPLSSMRKVIANRLTQSKQEIPHYYLSVDIQMDKIQIQFHCSFARNFRRIQVICK